MVRNDIIYGHIYTSMKATSTEHCSVKQKLLFVIYLVSYKKGSSVN